MTIVVAPGPPSGVFRHDHPYMRPRLLFHPLDGARVADGGPPDEPVRARAVPVAEIAKVAAMRSHVQVGDSWLKKRGLFVVWL